MANNPERTEFWKEFICTQCQFPNPERLRAQFAAATFFDFCNCGCNSFRVRFSDSTQVRPIAQKGRSGPVFEADFKLEEEKTLEILLFADDEGNLSYVEIDCCANTFPVPDAVKIKEPPFSTSANERLLR